MSWTAAQDRKILELQRKRLEIKEALLKKRSRDMLSLLALNEKQREFCNSTAKMTMLRGPNQAGGKSTAGCCLLAQVAPGRYLPWYKGRRWDRPIVGAIAGVKAQTTRDLLTNRLLGPHYDRGSGYIPEDCFDPIEDISYARGGIENQIESFRITHHGPDGKPNGKSVIYCFAYKSGWEVVQGYPLDFILLDEEPPWMVFDELRARTIKTKGSIYIAETPLKGMTELQTSFEEAENSDVWNLINYTIDDATHLTLEEREEIKRDWENHPLAEARLYGRPCRGEGPILWMTRDDLIVQPKAIPEHWPKIIGLDFPHTTSGTFAAAKLALDEQNDIVYMTGSYKAKGQPASVYADRVAKMGGKTIPVAWPHDGNRMDGTTTIAKKYQGYGLKMLPKCAHHTGLGGQRSTAVGPIIDELVDRAGDGRFKVFDTPDNEEFFEEKKQWRYVDGKIPKGIEDHIIDGLVKGLMALRFARTGTDEDYKRAVTSLSSLDSSNKNFFSDFGTVRNAW